MTKTNTQKNKRTNEAQEIIESMEKGGLCVPAQLRVAAETHSLLQSIRNGTPFMPAALRKVEGK